MEIVNNAIMRQIGVEKGIIEDKKLVTTHTHNAEMIREMAARNIDPNKKLEKHQLDSLIIKVTKSKARSLENKRKELIAYGVISEKYDEYRLIMPIPEFIKNKQGVAKSAPKPVSKQEQTEVESILLVDLD